MVYQGRCVLCRLPEPLDRSFSLCFFDWEVCGLCDLHYLYPCWGIRFGLSRRSSRHFFLASSNETGVRSSVEKFGDGIGTGVANVGPRTAMMKSRANRKKMKFVRRLDILLMLYEYSNALRV